MNRNDNTIKHRSTANWKFIEVSQHYDFIRDRTVKDSFCSHCNRMSEIRKKPTRCRRHSGGVYA